MANCKECLKYKQCKKVHIYTILQRVCFEFNKKQRGEDRRCCAEKLTEAWNERIDNGKL